MMKLSESLVGTVGNSGGYKKVVIALLAQLVEQVICNDQVGGSSPSRGSKMSVDETLFTRNCHV